MLEGAEDARWSSGGAQLARLQALAEAGEGLLDVFEQSWAYC
ncbi:hypothetical protein [Polaromonas sp.]|nr:hypothetical protein [Polaromonas sp.]